MDDIVINKLHTYTASEIANKAEKLLIDTGYLAKLPCPIEKIIESLNFTAHLFTPNENTASISGAVDRKTKKIYVNANDSPQRRFFTAAHEVGHVYLHPSEEQHVDFRESFFTSDPRENEANLFAACLLMPENEFRKQWKKYEGDRLSLSKFFGTSKSAIESRIIYLGLE